MLPCRSSSSKSRTRSYSRVSRRSTATLFNSISAINRYQLKANNDGFAYRSKLRLCRIGDLVRSSEGGLLSIQSSRGRQVQEQNAADADRRQYQDQGVVILAMRVPYGRRGVSVTHSRGPLLKWPCQTLWNSRCLVLMGADAEALVCQTAQRMLF